MSRTGDRRIEIDIVSDVVCPWCVIGFKQLERAMGETPDIKFGIRWHPFELNPQMPPEGQDLGEHMREKYGAGPEQGKATRNRLEALGEELGFALRYRADMRIYNTFRAHQLLHWAEQEGRQTQLQLALFAAYFQRGEDVSDDIVLVAAAGRAGLDETEARSVLAEGRHAEAVREAEREWLGRGIQAVPAFIFERRYIIPGAQEALVFRQFFDRLETADTA